jgi:hypothetical protein
VALAPAGPPRHTRGMGERDDYDDRLPPPWRLPRWAIDLLAILTVIAAIFQAGLFLHWLSERS